MADEAAAERLVKRALEPGSERLDADALKPLKLFARQSDRHVLLVFDQIWRHLGARSSQTRFAALRLCEELWPRSSAFRHKLMEHIHEFVTLTIGNSTAPLPGPTRWSGRLSELAFQLLQKWVASHGSISGYRPLTFALRHLQKNSSGTAAIHTSLRGVEAADAEQRATQIYDRYRTLSETAWERLGEMRQSLAKIKECLRVLAPTMEEAQETEGAVMKDDSRPQEEIKSLSAESHLSGGEFDGEPHLGMGDDEDDEENEQVEEDEDEDEDEGGGLPNWMMNWEFEVDLSLPEQSVERDYAPLLEALRDAQREVRKSFQPELRSWLRTLTRVDVTDMERRQHANLFEQVVRVKGELAAVMRRADLLMPSGATSDLAHAPESANSSEAADLLSLDVTIGSGGLHSPSKAGEGLESMAEAALTKAQQPLSASVQVKPMQSVNVASYPEIPSFDKGTPCSAARRDGSLCTRLVPPGHHCPFHGVLVERDSAGIPCYPSGVYAFLRSSSGTQSPGPYEVPIALCPSVTAGESCANLGANFGSSKNQIALQRTVNSSIAPDSSTSKPTRKTLTTKQRLRARMKAHNR